jgi:predicted RNase H-like HicB family nuclease
MSEPQRYSMRIEWSDEDQVFVVNLPEWDGARRGTR